MVVVNRTGTGRGTSGSAGTANRQRRAAVVAGAAYLTVLVAVMTGVTQAFDRAAADWFRPNDEWGPVQMRLGPIVDALEPRRAYAVLAVVTIAVCFRRWSWQPAAFAVVVAGASIGVTIPSKVLTHRPDLSGVVSSTGGSFPSGHVIALSVCLGCCALMLWRRTRWWHWVLVAIPPAFMSASILYGGAHWVTDVIGGALLAVATLCWAASLRVRTSMMEPRRPRNRAGSSETRRVSGRA